MYCSEKQKVVKVFWTNLNRGDREECIVMDTGRCGPATMTAFQAASAVCLFTLKRFYPILGVFREKESV